MSKSEIIQSFKIAFLSIGIIMLTGQVFAMTWYEPTASFPDDNAPEPVNITEIDQDKLGRLETKGLYSYAGGYIQTLLRVGGKYTLEPYLDKDTNLLVAGKVGINMDEAESIPLYAVDVRGDMMIRTFTSALNPGVNYPAPVCVNANGDLFLCL